MRSASAVEMIPTCSSLSSTRRMGEMRICSLWRKFVEMAKYLSKTARLATPARAGRPLRRAKA